MHVTATVTPRLGLISPVTTDDFKTSELATTFGTLDQYPGILNVANQASRPTTWTEKQHGSTCRQLDQMIDWVWYQPTSGSAGVWKRLAGKGLLHSQTNAGAVSSGATVYTSGATVIQTPSIILPGGRPIRVSISWDTCGNTGGIGVGSYWEGSTLIQSFGINGYDYPSGNWSRLGLAEEVSVTRDLAPTTQVSMAFRWTISAYAFSGVGGTTTIRGTVLTVEEI